MEQVSAVARVEPLTTARTLRGPFDYERPEGVVVGSLLEVPFGHQTLLGVVTALADASDHELVAPRRVLRSFSLREFSTLAQLCSAPSAD